MGTEVAGYYKHVPAADFLHQFSEVLGVRAMIGWISAWHPHWAVDYAAWSSGQICLIVLGPCKWFEGV